MVSDGKTRIQITISLETLEKLDALCAQIGISRSAAAAFALSDWMKRVSEDKAVSK